MRIKEIHIFQRLKYRVTKMHKNRNLDPLSSNPQNSQTHSHKSSSKADKLIECV